jgi:hypothetical protein
MTIADTSLLNHMLLVYGKRIIVVSLSIRFNTKGA